MTTEEISKMFAEMKTSNLITDIPTPKGILKINNNVSFQLYDKLPCWFHRWMARILLGWKYEMYKDE